jgi:hypothetical protein
MSIGAFSATSEAALSAVLMSVELVVDFAAPHGKTNYSRQIIAMQNDADQFAADKSVPAVDG